MIHFFLKRQKKAATRVGEKMEPAKEMEKAEAETIKKMKPSFFTSNGDIPITLLALIGKN